MNPNQNTPLSITHLGSFAQILERPDGAMPPGKRFLSGPVSLTSCEISVNRIPAGYGYGFTHRHKKNEEIYIVVGGHGIFYADGVQHPVQEGSVVRVAPAVVRTLEALPDTPLDYICVQAPEGGMPYSFIEDGVPVSAEVPSKKTLPLPPMLKAYFEKVAAGQK
jgi:mannose-6-phosphate isomerase-like protein (cupin superfamily)